MGFDQYHEPPDELPQEARTLARMFASLTEEAEAIGWYAQRLALEQDGEAAAIMRNAQEEEFKHFSMDLEFLLRKLPEWRAIAKGVLFQDGDIVGTGRTPRRRPSSRTGVRWTPGPRRRPPARAGTRACGASRA